MGLLLSKKMILGLVAAGVIAYAWDNLDGYPSGALLFVAPLLAAAVVGATVPREWLPSPRRSGIVTSASVAALLLLALNLSPLNEWPIHEALRHYEKNLLRFSSSGAKTPAKVGLFQIEDVVHDGDAVFFELGSFWATSQGLAYLPSGPPRHAKLTVRPLTQRHWYRYSWGM